MKKFLILALCLCLLTSTAFAFTDTADHPLTDYITDAAAIGVINGYPDDTFRPDAPVDRAGFAAMMNRALGISGCAVATFTDIPSGAWYAADVEKALSVGYINGKGDNKFAPTDPVTRGEAALILMRLANVTPTDDCDYPDYADAADWLKPGMQYAWQSGLYDSFVPKDESFLPREPMTRAQCAAVITSFLKSLDTMPVYMTLCAESDTALDTESDNYLYVNLFGKGLFQSICTTLGSDTNVWSDPEEAKAAYDALAEVISLTQVPTELTVTGCYLLELTPDLAYVGLTVTPTSEKTASVELTIVPADPENYHAAAGFEVLTRTYTDRVSRITAATNLSFAAEDGSSTVHWVGDDRLSGYSLLLISSDGMKIEAYTGDIIRSDDGLTADVTALMTKMNITEGTILILGHTKDGTVTRPVMLQFPVTEPPAEEAPSETTEQNAEKTEVA